MVMAFAIPFSKNGLLQVIIDLGKKVLEVIQKMLRNKYSITLRLINNLAISYHNLGCMQEAMNLKD